MQINEFIDWRAQRCGAGSCPEYYMDFADMSDGFMDYEEQIKHWPAYADKYSKEMWEISDSYIFEMDQLTYEDERYWDYDEPKIAKLYKD